MWWCSRIIVLRLIRVLDATWSSRGTGAAGGEPTPPSVCRSWSFRYGFRHYQKNNGAEDRLRYLEDREKSSPRFALLTVWNTNGICRSSGSFSVTDVYLTSAPAICSLHVSIICVYLVVLTYIQRGFAMCARHPSTLDLDIESTPACNRFMIISLSPTGDFKLIIIC